MTRKWKRGWIKGVSRIPFLYILLHDENSYSIWAVLALPRSRSMILRLPGWMGRKRGYNVRLWGYNCSPNWTSLRFSQLKRTWQQRRRRGFRLEFLIFSFVYLIFIIICSHDCLNRAWELRPCFKGPLFFIMNHYVCG